MVSLSCDNWHLDGDREIESVKGLWALVVDDNADSLELVSVILEGYGIQVLKAESASEALKAIAQIFPNILISDIAMPGEDGYELIRQIRVLESEQKRFLPAIALTAYAGEEERTRALEAGFQVHVLKPVEPSELVAAVALLAERFPPKS